MDNTIFADCIDRMGDHFGKRLKDSREYAQALSGVPGEASEDICRGRIWDNAPIPSKFPTIRDLLDDWMKWLRDHPDKQEPIAWEFCPYCEPDTPGLIRVQIPSTNPEHIKMGYTHRNSMVRCRHCNNGQHRNPTWPRLCRDEIEGRGWAVATDYHEIEDEEEAPIPTPREDRRPWFTHIEKSLQAGDREQDDSDLPF